VDYASTDECVSSVVVDITGSGSASSSNAYGSFAEAKGVEVEYDVEIDVTYKKYYYHFAIKFVLIVTCSRYQSMSVNLLKSF